MKRASGTLNKFGIQLTLGLETIANGFGRVLGALPRAIKGAVDHADALGKTAQKAGVTVEALSRLEYAAKLSDVSLEGLSTGLRKLSQNMLAVATGTKGPAAVAFAALGISVTDAAGKLRASDDVLADIADRFARMPDSAEKTALAMGLLGKSGADLIPLLNAGRDGLRAMADESDRFGVTISTKTAKAAEVFNDSLTKMNAIFGGIVLKIMEALLPAMQSIATTVSSPEFSQAITGVATMVGELLNGLLQFAVGVKRALDDLFHFADRNGAMPGAMKRLGNSLEALQSGQKRNIPASKLYAGMVGDDGNINLLDPPKSTTATTPVDPFEIPTLGAKKLRNQVEITIPRITEMQQAFLDLGSTVESSLSGIMSGLVKDVIKGGDAFSGLIDKVGQFGEKLIDMAASQAIQGLFGSIMGLFGGGMGMGAGAIGRGVFGGTGGFFPAFPGFDGGGFTGAGARVGGIDGRGGFLATLHPNETVVDHTRGGGAGGLTVNVDARGAQQGVAEQLDQWARFTLPSIIRRHANSTMPENG